MPALKPTEFRGHVTWLGRVPHRNSDAIEGLALDRLDLGFGGLADEIHAGLTRPSCSRVTAQHPRGTEIANVRQLSVLSAEELAEIAAKMDVANIDPALVGASLVVEGLPDFSHLPPSARLQGPDGVTLVIDMQNRPCHLPAIKMEKVLGPKGKRFKQAAKGLRGVTAWVERPGSLTIGDALRLHLPDQRPWRGIAAKAGAEQQADQLSAM